MGAVRSKDLCSKLLIFPFLAFILRCKSLIFLSPVFCILGSMKIKYFASIYGIQHLFFILLCLRNFDGWGLGLCIQYPMF